MCIGHRLINYSGRCRNVHGHEITVEIGLGPRELDKVGMAIDFDLINGFFKQLDDAWDHAFLVNDSDKVMIEFLDDQLSKKYIIRGNPTMENLVQEAVHQFKAFCIDNPSLPADILTYVTIYEKSGNDNGAVTFLN